MVGTILFSSSTRFKLPGVKTFCRFIYYSTTLYSAYPSQVRIQDGYKTVARARCLLTDCCACVREEERDQRDSEGESKKGKEKHERRERGREARKILRGVKKGKSRAYHQRSPDEE